MAKLHFKYGAMNSGKSTVLLNTAYNYEERGMNVVIIKSAIDTKGDNSIEARAGLRREVDILSHPDMNLREEALKFALGKKAIECILVDEAQFITANQADQLFEIAKLDDISVIAHGLRTDFRREMFPGSKRLLELADNIEKLKTMCSCGSQAEFNTRQDDGVFVFEGDQVAIDGDKKITYQSLCGKCYLGEMNAAKA